MEAEIRIRLKGLGFCADQEIVQTFAEGELFIEILRKVLERIIPEPPLDQIAILSIPRNILSYSDVHLSLGTLMLLYGIQFEVVPRQEVNGPNLVSLEPESERQSSEMKLLSSLESSKLDSEGSKEEMKEEMEEEVLAEEESILGEESFLKPKIQPKPGRSSWTESSEGDIALPPPLPPPSPSVLPPPPPPGSGLYSEELSQPAPQPTPQPSSQPPPQSSTEVDGDGDAEVKLKKKAVKGQKERRGLMAKQDTGAAEMENTMAENFEREEEADEVVGDTAAVFREEPALLPAQEAEKSYQKNLSVEYFNVMNPDKYYPLVLNIANFKQAVVQAQENILTGEKRVQKQETMDVTVKESLILVRPVFPGCSVTPGEIMTNFDDEEDELTFFVTPLVNDDLDECRIDFLGMDQAVLHSIATPAKVQDPLVARTIAFYGSLASVVPKILVFFDINVGAEVLMEEALPWIQGVIGGMNLPNFIGLFGIVGVIIVSLIVYFTRKPKSVQKRFSVGDIRRSGSGLRLRHILKAMKSE